MLEKHYCFLKGVKGVGYIDRNKSAEMTPVLSAFVYMAVVVV